MFWRDLFSSVVFLTFGLTGFAAIFGNIEADSERLAAKKHWLNVFRQELGLVIYVIIVLIGLYFFGAILVASNNRHDAILGFH
ncbi:hypothetical protein [Secundilactobacillus collinoides]|uniref:hypothetical protein n=1 Tax=Secundilactobacillus collinoides TaxID=33960 RepID=UPI0006D29586|nr:hypothetical protein [Secundilactobacillus collinoides]